MFNVQRIMLEANCIFKVDRTISGDISALMLYRASEEEEEEGLKICIHRSHILAFRLRAASSLLQRHLLHYPLATVYKKLARNHTIPIPIPIE